MLFEKKLGFYISKQHFSTPDVILQHLRKLVLHFLTTFNLVPLKKKITGLIFVEENKKNQLNLLYFDQFHTKEKC